MMTAESKVLAFRKRYISQTPDSTNVLGKVLPHDTRAEQAVLGAMLIDRDAVGLVMGTLKPESFYHELNAVLFGTIQAMYSASLNIDIVSVTKYMSDNGTLPQIGSAYYLVELTNCIASAANIEHHAAIVAAKHLRRALITACHATVKEAFSEDAFDAKYNAEERLFGITNQYLPQTTKPIGSLLSVALKNIEQASQQTANGGLTGVPSGYTAIDRLTGGWQSSDLIVVAARPGMGKTSLTLGITLNAALEFKRPVAFFSLEMSNLQLANRLISMLAQVPSEKIRNGKLNSEQWSQLSAVIDKVTEAPIFIDDTPSISIFDLRAKARRLKQTEGIEIIIVDYLQLMTADSNGNREQEISSISRQLKGLAKELNIPVIALAQLSRAVETRGGAKRPQLSDLRESGAIEQDADIVSFLYRPEYYGIMEDENGVPLKGIAEFILAKHRNGALDTAKLRWDGHFAQFSNVEETPNTSGFSASYINDEIVY